MLSDAYPPYSAGGAELSLRASITSLPAEVRKEIAIVTFSGLGNQIELSTDQDCLVVHTPRAMGWPYEAMFKPEFDEVKNFRGLGERTYARYVRLRRSVFSNGSDLFRLAYKESRIAPEGGILTDHLLNQSDARVQFVSSICDSMKRVDRLIADNTRSILIASAVPDFNRRIGTSVAIVRDNRFHCARPSQSRIVGGKHCVECKFGCAAEDAPAQKSAVMLRERTLKLTDAYRKSALRTYDSVLVTSHELKRHIGRIISSDQKLYRVPNSVGKFSELESFGLGIAKSETPTLLMIGMLNENKGQLAFLRAATDWLHENPDVKLVFAGRGDRMQEKIRQHAREHALSERVTLRGYLSREALFREIAKATIIIAPTVWPEPFGRVPLEAAVCRKAVVAFAVGGLNESIVDGKTGILVEPANYDRFLESIDLLINDPSLRSKMELQAFDWITSMYGPENTTDRFAKLVFGS